MPNQRVEYVPGMRGPDFERHSRRLGMDSPGTISDVLRVRIAGDLVYFDGYASHDLTCASASKRVLQAEMMIPPEEIQIYKKLITVEEVR